MKTAMIARFVLGAGAIFAVAGLAGCGAGEQGSGDPVGSSEQALTTSNPVVAAAGTVASLTTLDPDPDGRIFPASCVIHDDHMEGNTHIVRDLKIVAGGYISTGAASSDIFSYDPAGNTWTKLAVSLGTARGELEGMQDPTDPTKCIFVGGATGVTAAAVKKVDQLVLSGGTFTLNAKTDLNVARSNFFLSTCGSQWIAIGGRDGTSKLQSIEVANSLAPTGWTNYNNGVTAAGTYLVDGRYDFGADKDPWSPAAGDRYLLAGGHGASAARVKSIEIVKTSTVSTTTCVPSVTRFNTDDTSDPDHPIFKTLSAAVEGNRAFFEGTHTVVGGATTVTNFINEAGYDGSTYPVASDEIAVTWAGPSIVVSQGAYTLGTGVYRPTLVKSAADAHMILGGFTAGGNFASGTPSAASTAVQQYQDTYGYHTATLNTARAGAVAELISGNVYLTFGRSFGTPDYLLTGEKITP